MPTAHLLITGKVQGVFYRASAKAQAEKIGITGWIKNTFNGDVEAVISGNKAAMDDFIHWCKKGPPRAVVLEIIVTPKEDQCFFEFSIER